MFPDRGLCVICHQIELIEAKGKEATRFWTWSAAQLLKQRNTGNVFFTQITHRMKYVVQGI